MWREKLIHIQYSLNLKRKKKRECIQVNIDITVPSCVVYCFNVLNYLFIYLHIMFVVVVVVFLIFWKGFFIFKKCFLFFEMLARILFLNKVCHKKFCSRYIPGRVYERTTKRGYSFGLSKTE